HIAFNHNNPVAYLLGELSSQVSILSYDAATGSFELIATLPTIPEDYTDHNGAAAIRLSSDQRFLYVSNRGFNSLTVLLSVRMVATYHNCNKSVPPAIFHVISTSTSPNAMS
ncbi:3-carboxymuconate cyclase, partial [Lacticaseibacillus rhamnosus MTCC 5462]